MIGSHALSVRDETPASPSTTGLLSLAAEDFGCDVPASHSLRFGLASVDRSRTLIPLAAEHLTTEETARGLRYLREIDRERFILGRYLVRVMLMEHFGIPHCDAGFKTSQYGKPHLPSRPDITFSIAHSGDLVMVAMGIDLQIGIDVEMHRHDIDLSAISQSVFTPAERKSVFNGTADAAVTRFFRQWTRKEALTKALGTGLAKDPLRFEIEPEADALTAVFVGDGADDIGQDWSINSLDVASGYSAALVWRKG